MLGLFCSFILIYVLFGSAKKMGWTTPSTLPYLWATFNSFPYISGLPKGPGFYQTLSGGKTNCSFSTSVIGEFLFRSMVGQTGSNILPRWSENGAVDSGPFDLCPRGPLSVHVILNRRSRGLRRDLGLTSRECHVTLGG